MDKLFIRIQTAPIEIECKWRPLSVPGSVYSTISRQVEVWRADAKTLLHQNVPVMENDGHYHSISIEFSHRNGKELMRRRDINQLNFRSRNEFWISNWTLNSSSKTTKQIVYALKYKNNVLIKRLTKNFYFQWRLFYETMIDCSRRK